MMGLDLEDFKRILLENYLLGKQVEALQKDLEEKKKAAPELN